MRISFNVQVSKVTVPDIAGQPGPTLEGVSVRTSCEMNTEELKAYTQAISNAFKGMVDQLQALKGA